jgi:acetyl esterase/lipase
MSEDILDRAAPPANHRLAYGPAAQQFGDLRLPLGEGPFPVVVGIHGGYWRARYDLTYFGHVCAALTARGMATWNIEYRRLGDVGGGWPGTLLDVAAAADHLRALAPTYHLDLTRLVAVGHSAGGHLACWLAGRGRIPPDSPVWSAEPLSLRGVVSLAGVLDLRRGWELHLSQNIVEQFLGGTPTTVPERYDVASPYELPPLGVRQTLLHGTADDSVPFELSERYAARARERGDIVSLISLPCAGHFELVDPTSAEWSAVERAAVELVRPS